MSDCAGCTVTLIRRAGVVIVKGGRHSMAKTFPIADVAAIAGVVVIAHRAKGSWRVAAVCSNITGIQRALVVIRWESREWRSWLTDPGGVTELNAITLVAIGTRRSGRNRGMSDPSTSDALIDRTGITVIWVDADLNHHFNEEGTSANGCCAGIAVFMIRRVEVGTAEVDVGKVRKIWDIGNP